MKIFKASLYKEIFGLLVQAGNSFMENKVLRHSAALAYYTIFSIAPLLMIVIWLVGFLYGDRIDGQDGAQAEIFGELEEMLGAETTRQIEDVIRQISESESSTIGIIVGIGTVIFGSTTIFFQIQQSINFIWDIRPKPKRGWLQMIVDRATSLGMVLGLGFLLVTSLLLNAIVVALSEPISRYIPGLTAYTLEWINTGLTFVIISTLFGCIFRFLPDARVRFKDILGGAIFTALLFMLGSFLIGLYMTYTAPGSVYGAAGSIIILLLWINYSAAILFFGAEFTKAYAEKYGNGIIPKSYAVRLIHEEIETTEPKLSEEQEKKIAETGGVDPDMAPDTEESDSK